MNAPPTFESFLLYEGEKKYVLKSIIYIKHLIKMIYIYDFLYLIKNYQRTRHKSSQCCDFYC